MNPANAANEFLDALAVKVPKEERLIVCGFGEEPDYAPPNAWKPRPWIVGRDLCYECGILDNWNAYVAVSSFNRAADGSFRRRGACYASGLALMVDDVGTGPGSKVAPSVIEAVPPSAIVETSPDNLQCWYFLDEPCRDQGLFDGVIRAFISGKLLGADPGMAGVARVGRIPGYINNKSKYGGRFRVQLKSLTIQRYSIEELLKAFDLKINGRRDIREKLTGPEAIERNRAFTVYYKWLQKRGMLRRDVPDAGGWSEMTCAWIENHTGQADTGAAIREPSSENGFYGAYRCHHGGCAEKGWRELTDWIDEMSVEELNEANK